MIIVIDSNYGKKEISFDDKYWPKLSKYKWHINNDKGNFYARAHFRIGSKFKSIKMHRIIMNVLNTPHIHIDHIDSNGLNNMKSNLRRATIAENSRNVCMTARSTTGYKGVYLYKSGYNIGKYTATLVINGNKIFGGYFKTAIEAAIKYNSMARKHHKKFAYQNIVSK